jgi:transposase-like protein
VGITKQTPEKQKTVTSYGAEFKERVALDAIKGIKTVQEIAADTQVHHTQVTQWKTQMLAEASQVFA